MPSKPAQRVAADTPSTSTAAELDQHDASGAIPGDGEAGAKTSGKAPAQMDADRGASSTATRSQSRSNNFQADASGIGASQSGNLGLNNRGSAMHIADSTTPRRPVESSIWDWDTPNESVSDSASCYYEPQGELLQERRDQRQIGSEFAFPRAVGNAPGTWQFSGGDPSSAGSNGFAIPKRPICIVPPIAGAKRKFLSEIEPSSATSQPDKKRLSRAMSGDGDDAGSVMEETAQTPTQHIPTPSNVAGRARSTTDTTSSRPRPGAADTQGERLQRPGPGAGGGLRRTLTDPTIPMVLPPRKVFPIQIGDKLFRLSGASISSDAPSYFSQFFEEQLRQNEGADSVRTLYIDRDPATFEDISLHLQGYHIEPRDGPHFVKLFADAQFFSLPRLTAQLFSSTIYIRIGDSEFQIPRDLFSNPGDSPNYFSLGFSIFFTTPADAFPGLSQRTLLRPPSILPPSVPNRSAKTFADLLHILKGYPLEIRSEGHRTELLRDARYFHLKGLEQKLIPHSISYNLARKITEILVRLEDIRQSGISFVADSSAPSSPAAACPGSSASSLTGSAGWVYYQRPYVDSEAYSLIMEVGGTEECTMLSVAPRSSSSVARFGRATFHRQTLSRITSLFSVIANKMNLPITQPLGLMMMERGAGVASLPVSPGNTGVSQERVKVRIGSDADVIVDGRKWPVGEDEEDDSEEGSMNIDPSESSRSGAKRRRTGDEEDEGEEWVVRKAQWRLRVQPVPGTAQGGRMEVILGAVKIEAYSVERSRNASRGFLT